MTIFELLKVALDQLYKDGRAAHGDKIDKKIKQGMERLSKSYSDLRDTNREPIDYRDPAVRFAYAYKYVAAHGDYMVQVLHTLRAHTDKPLFTNETVRVSCIGGGPGSDIIAVLKYLSDRGKKEPVKKVTCYLLDAEQAWADVWTELDDSFKTNVALNANFQPINVADPNSWKLQKKFLQADLFTMSYFVSEVMSRDGNGTVSKFWRELFREAKPGARFLYVDNGHKDFNAYFDKLWQSVGLKEVISLDNIRFTPSGSEQASELAKYSAKFGEHPKLQATISYRVLKKPR